MGSRTFDEKLFASRGRLRRPVPAFANLIAASHRPLDVHCSFVAPDGNTIQLKGCRAAHNSILHITEHTIDIALERITPTAAALGDH